MYPVYYAFAGVCANGFVRGFLSVLQACLMRGTDEQDRGST